ncbi:MAG: DUF1501 domain-containing protein [Cyclobacteriaceae bacterium]
MKRRDFVKCLGHSMAVPAVLGSFGLHSASASALNKLMQSASEEGRVLVLIYLNGGNDGLNTIIPLTYYSELNHIRPDVILKENSLLKLSDQDLAFHPALNGFKNLYEEGRLSVIQNVGYPNQDFSHFRSTDIWNSTSDADKVVDSGWVGRYLTDKHPEFPEAYPNESFPHPLSIEFGNSNSLTFQGQFSTMSMVISDPESYYNLLEDIETPAPDGPAGDRLKFVRLIAKQSQLYGQVVKEAAEKAGDQEEYPNTDLAKQLRIVAQLISGGLRTPVYKVQLRGFDTHSDQVEAADHTTGVHSDLLAELDQAVMTFMKDIEKMGRADDVVGLTYSEFGRRVVSNASLGTDHGAAAPMFAFGNKIMGGILGSTPVIDKAMTAKDNLEAEFDFRQVYSSIIEQWFMEDRNQVSSALLGEFETLPLIKESKSLLSNQAIPSYLSVYPNPLYSQATIKLSSNGSPLRVDLMDLNGRTVETIYSGLPNSGLLKLDWNTSNLHSGRYFVAIYQNGERQVKSVVKK